MIRRIYIWVMLIGLMLPIVVVFAAALNSGRTMRFPPQDPTLSRFVEFFTPGGDWIEALTNSVLIAAASGLLAGAIAWPLAYLVWRYGRGMPKALLIIAVIPFLVPPIIYGVGLGFVFAPLGLLGTKLAAVLGHSILFVAIPLVTVSVAMSQVDPSQIDAARTMGATDGEIMRTVLWPQTIHYLISGCFFVMVLSFNEFIVVLFVSAAVFPTVTLEIFNSLRNGFTPTMAVGAVTFLFATAIILAAIARITHLPRLLGGDPERDI